MSKDNHKIDADDRTVFDVLNERKYTVDYFQREYSWKDEHIEQLVTDLTTSFRDAYTEGDPRHAVEHYNNYYLGPFVVSSKSGMRSIIDGQQRLTSLTLFLIYLNNLQKELGCNESIEPLVFSEKYGQKSFNIQVPEREECLNKLFLEGCYETKPDDDESTANMVRRYADIVKAFPEEIQGNAFPYFLDWLKYNVILVEITAYSDDNAYTIFESMNDRGLNLTSTEMLKGYLLSRFTEAKDREKANKFWRESIQTLHRQNKDEDQKEDQKFFQAWLRSQYADTIRQGKAGSSNEDFEKIGTRFHSWFRDNLSKIGVNAESPDDFRELLHGEMKFYLRSYLEILDAQKAEKAGWENVFYHSQWGVADSLGLPLMLAPLKSTDSPDVACTAQHGGAGNRCRTAPFRDQEAPLGMRFFASLVAVMAAKGLGDFAERLRALHFVEAFPVESESLSANAAANAGSLVCGFAHHLHFDGPRGFFRATADTLAPVKGTSHTRFRGRTWTGWGKGESHLCAWRVACSVEGRLARRKSGAVLHLGNQRRLLRGCDHG